MTNFIEKTSKSSDAVRNNLQNKCANIEDLFKRKRR